MIPDKATLAEWRRLAADTMTSAVGEYTPSEFTVLLDAVDELQKERDDLQETVRLMEGIVKQYDRQSTQLVKLVQAAEMVMGDWKNVRTRDYLRAVLNWIEYGHEIKPERYPYQKGGE